MFAGIHTGGASSITINGVTITGNNIRVINNQVIVDGQAIDFDTSAKRLEIHVTGNLATLTCDAPATVTGDVGAIEKVNGPLKVGGNVTGSIGKVNGPVTCGNVGGDLHANGPVSMRR